MAANDGLGTAARGSPECSVGDTAATGASARDPGARADLTINYYPPARSQEDSTAASGRLAPLARAGGPGARAYEQDREQSDGNPARLQALDPWPRTVNER